MVPVPKQVRGCLQMNMWTEFNYYVRVIKVGIQTKGFRDLNYLLIVFISYGCCNKLPQTQWFKTSPIYYRTIPKNGSQLVKNQWVGRAVFFIWRDFISCTFHLHSLASGPVPPSKPVIVGGVCLVPYHSNTHILTPSSTHKDHYEHLGHTPTMRNSLKSTC